MADEKYTHKSWESPGLDGANAGSHDGESGAAYPKRLYREGHSMSVADAEAEAAAAEDGWAVHPAHAAAAK